MNKKKHRNVTKAGFKFIDVKKDHKSAIYVLIANKNQRT